MPRDVCRLLYLQAIPFSFSRINYCILHQPHPGQSPITLCIVLSLNHVVFALAFTALPSHAVPHLYFSFLRPLYVTNCFAQQANHSLRYFNLILDPGPDALIYICIATERTIQAVYVSGWTGDAKLF